MNTRPLSPAGSIPVRDGFSFPPFLAILVTFLLLLPGTALAWSVAAVNPGDSSQIDWLESEHGALTVGGALRIETTYYRVTASGPSPWSGSGYLYAALQECDQVNGQSLGAADLSSSTGATIVRAYDEWPAWKVYSINPDWPTEFDWYSSEHAPLADASYLRLGDTYYFVEEGSLGYYGSYWTGSGGENYYWATLQECDQLTGQPLGTHPDLSGLEGEDLLRTYATWPVWKVFSVDPDNPDWLDWPTAEHALPAVGDYLRVGTLYYLVADAATTSWHGAPYSKVQLEECDPVDGTASGRQADLAGSEGAALRAYTTWPAWKVYSVNPDWPSEFDWQGDEHPVLADNSYLRLGDTIYFVEEGSLGYYGSYWTGGGGENYYWANLQECDQQFGYQLGTDADLRGLEGEQIHWNYPNWPEWTTYSINPDDSSQLDYKTDGSIDYSAEVGDYLLVGDTYYRVDQSFFSTWNGSDYLAATLQQCNQATGAPLGVAADLTHMTGAPLRRYDSWPEWKIHSVKASDPAAIDWPVNEHDLPAVGDYLRVGGTYYLVDQVSSPSWSGSGYYGVKLAACDQVYGYHYADPIDMRGREGEIIYQHYATWPSWKVNASSYDTIDWQWQEHDPPPAESYLRVGDTYYMVAVSDSYSWLSGTGYYSAFLWEVDQYNGQNNYSYANLTGSEGMVIKGYDTWPEWKIYSVDPADSSRIDWPVNEHDLPAVGDYLRVGDTYYLVDQVSSPSWSGSGYYGVKLAACDQVYGYHYADPIDMRGREGEIIYQHYTTWPSWKVNASSYDTIDWQWQEHDPPPAESYLRVGDTYYMVAVSDSYSWLSGTGYYSAFLWEVDQYNGQNNYSYANLTGSEGMVIKGYDSWPGWKIYSVDPDDSSRIDWLGGEHQPLAAGSYLRVGATYYSVVQSDSGFWNYPYDVTYAKLEQCNQATGAPTGDPADLRGLEGDLLEAFADWPFPPTATVISASLSADSGYDETDFITNVAGQTVSGGLSENLAANQTVEVSFDNGATFLPADSFTVGSSAWSTSITLAGAGIFQARLTNPYGSGPVFSQPYRFDDQPPTVTAARISLGGATGNTGIFKVGDSVTASWDNSPGGDSNTDIHQVNIDFSQFSGSAAIAAVNGGGIWTAASALPTGALDAGGLNVTVTATDTAGNSAGTTGTNNAIADTIAPAAATGTLSVAENSANGTPAGTVTSSGASSYALTGDAGGRFAIASGSGQVTVANGSLLDFESATSHQITVRSADPAGNSTDSQLSVAVTNVNDAPVITSTAPTSATEETLYTYTATVEDPDDANNGTDLTWSLANEPNGMVVSATGVVTWTPAEGITSSGEVTLRVADGGEDGAQPATETFTVTVTPVNDPPVIISTAPATATEDILYTYIATVEDPDDANNGTDLSWSLANEPNGMVVSATGVVTWTPGEGATSSGEVTLRVADGGEDGAPPATETFTITVTPVNDMPVVDTNAGLTVAEGSTNIGFGLQQLHATDADNDDLSELTFVVTAAPTSGTLRLGQNELSVQSGFTQQQVADQGLFYDHNGSEPAVEGFSFYVCDTGPAQQCSQPETFVIIVTPVNDPPVVDINAGLTVAEGSTNIGFGLQQLHAIDADNDDLTELTFVVTAAPTSGALRLGQTILSGQSSFTQQQVADQGLFYDHDGSEPAVEGFSFYVCDSSPDQQCSQPETFVITVTPVNDPPVISTNTGLSVVQGSTGNVIDETRLWATDPDNTSVELIFTVEAVPTHGVLQIGGSAISTDDSFPAVAISNHGLVYDHDGSAGGSDTISLTVSDRGSPGLPATQFVITVLADGDFDGVIDADDNCPEIANQNQRDVNDNEIGDVCDDGSDTDLDGLSDADESVIFGTDPDNPNSDGDILDDLDEVRRGTDPNSADSVMSLATRGVADFNDDLQDDLLLRDTLSGAWELVQLDNAAIQSQDPLVQGKAIEWQPVVVSDLAGDGRVNVLLRSAVSGRWKMGIFVGATRVDYGEVVMTTRLDWQPLAFFDFDGNGTREAVLRSKVSGEWNLVELDGLNKLGSDRLALRKVLDWQPVHIGDFDYDGKGDVLLRNNVSGQWEMGLFDGAVRLQYGVVPMTPNLDWQPQAFVDFSGDQKLDVVLRNTMSGEWNLVELDGLNKLGSDRLALRKILDWQPRYIGDMDADGQVDVLLRNVVSGAWELSSFDGATRTGYTEVALPADLAWTIRRIGDFNGDGSLDLLLRNSGTGNWQVVSLNGEVILSQDSLAVTTDLGWIVVP